MFGSATKGSSGLFGQNTTPATASTNLFGGGTSTGGLFGGSTPTNQAAGSAGGGLFGNSGLQQQGNTSSGLFGQSGSSGLFGGNALQNNTPAGQQKGLGNGGSSLFGGSTLQNSTPAGQQKGLDTSSSSLFGGTSIFGSSGTNVGGHGPGSGIGNMGVVGQNTSSGYTGVPKIILRHKDPTQLATGKTFFSDLSNDSKQQLQNLEKIMRDHKNGCEKVKENSRLNGGVSDRRQVEVEVHSLSQSLRTMARTMNVEYEALRTFHRDVYKLLEGADAAFSLHRRIYEAAQNNSKEVTSLDDTTSKPYFKELIQNMESTLEIYGQKVEELEYIIQIQGQHRSSESANTGAILREIVHNIYDLFLDVASNVQSLKEKVDLQKYHMMEIRRNAGDHKDPFKAEERRRANLKAMQDSRTAQDRAGDAQPQSLPVAPLQAGGTPAASPNFFGGAASSLQAPAGGLVGSLGAGISPTVPGNTSIFNNPVSAPSSNLFSTPILSDNSQAKRQNSKRRV